MGLTPAHNHHKMAGDAASKHHSSHKRKKSHRSSTEKHGSSKKRKHKRSTSFPAVNQETPSTETPSWRPSKFGCSPTPSAHLVVTSREEVDMIDSAAAKVGPPSEGDKLVSFSSLMDAQDQKKEYSPILPPGTGESEGSSANKFIGKKKYSEWVADGEVTPSKSARAEVLRLQGLKKAAAAVEGENLPERTKSPDLFNRQPSMTKTAEAAGEKLNRPEMLPPVRPHARILPPGYDHEGHKTSVILPPGYSTKKDGKTSGLKTSLWRTASDYELENTVNKMKQTPNPEKKDEKTSRQKSDLWDMTKLNELESSINKLKQDLNLDKKDKKRRTWTVDSQDGDDELQGEETTSAVKRRESIVEGTPSKKMRINAAFQWEHQLGGVGGALKGVRDSSEDTISYASQRITKNPGKGVFVSGVRFRVLKFASKECMRLPKEEVQSDQSVEGYQNGLSICSVAKGKVLVTIGLKTWGLSEGGMWRVRGNEECLVCDASGEVAVVHVTSIPSGGPSD